jgi:predicted ATPase
MPRCTLVIDQPEENLDPKSVFEELVTLFVEAKSNRQVIMVTHNANLVINTDADQIIVAESAAPPWRVAADYVPIRRLGERRHQESGVRHTGGR